MILVYAASTADGSYAEEVLFQDRETARGHLAELSQRPLNECQFETDPADTSREWLVNPVQLEKAPKTVSSRYFYVRSLQVWPSYAAEDYITIVFHGKPEVYSGVSEATQAASLAAGTDHADRTIMNVTREELLGAMVAHHQGVTIMALTEISDVEELIAP